MWLFELLSLVWYHGFWWCINNCCQSFWHQLSPTDSLYFQMLETYSHSKVLFLSTHFRQSHGQMLSNHCWEAHIWLTWERWGTNSETKFSSSLWWTLIIRVWYLNAFAQNFNQWYYLSSVCKKNSHRLFIFKRCFFYILLFKIQLLWVFSLKEGFQH